MMPAPGWALASLAALGVAGFKFRLKHQARFFQTSESTSKLGRRRRRLLNTKSPTDTRHSGACCKSEPRERQPEPGTVPVASCDSEATPHSRSHHLYHWQAATIFARLHCGVHSGTEAAVGTPE
jgi:hypothetical protein